MGYTVCIALNRKIPAGVNMSYDPNYDDRDDYDLEWGYRSHYTEKPFADMVPDIDPWSEAEDSAAADRSRSNALYQVSLGNLGYECEEFDHERSAAWRRRETALRNVIAARRWRREVLYARRPSEQDEIRSLLSGSISGLTATEALSIVRLPPHQLDKLAKGQYFGRWSFRSRSYRERWRCAGQTLIELRYWVQQACEQAEQLFQAAEQEWQAAKQAWQSQYVEPM